MYKETNPNPLKRINGDCVIRAISIATGQSWDMVFLSVCAYAYQQKNMPSANEVWGAYLYDLGFRRYYADADGLYMSVAEFAETHRDGIYILALDGHVVCVKCGDIYDTWDSGQETVIYFWQKLEDETGGTTNV